MGHDEPQFRWLCASPDRKSTRLNSSHTEIYTLSLHDALPIYVSKVSFMLTEPTRLPSSSMSYGPRRTSVPMALCVTRSEEHTSELQSHRDLHSFPTRRSSDLCLESVVHVDRANPLAVELDVVWATTNLSSDGFVRH